MAPWIGKALVVVLTTAAGLIAEEVMKNNRK